MFGGDGQPNLTPGEQTRVPALENVIAGFDIPTVNLAVGYEEIHTTKERIPVKELNKLAEMVLAIIESVNQK